MPYWQARNKHNFRFIMSVYSSKKAVTALTITAFDN